MRTSTRHPDRGASLAVLLVAVVILGLVTTVIVIGLRAHDEPPSTAECQTDHSALLRAEEAFHTKQGRYGAEAELVEAGLLEGASSLHDVTLTADSYRIVTTGACIADVVSSTPGQPAVAHVVVNAVPDTVTAGRVITPPITVTLTDESGAVVKDTTAEVTISLHAENGAKLSGTTTARAVAGVATFADVAIDKAGSGYTFAAESGGTTGASSTQVSVTPGMVAKLHFVASPASATPGVEFATQPVVEVEDVMGNVIADATDPIVLAITDNTGASGARLACANLSVVPIGGVAAFAGCQIDRAGTDYSLTATTTALSTASDGFAVIGSAAKLAIMQQPAQSVAGDTLPPIIVAVEDSAGNVITDSTATIDLAANKNIASLTGTTSVAVVDGVATFDDLGITTAATEYTLTMKATGLRSTTSVVFDIVTGPAAQLVFSRQPSGAKAGKSWSTQPIVTIEDAFGNVVITAVADITLMITPGRGEPGATLSCAFIPLAIANGEARFSKCSIDRAGSGYTLTATAPGVSDAVSGAFSIT